MSDIGGLRFRVRATGQVLRVVDQQVPANGNKLVVLEDESTGERQDLYIGDSGPDDAGTTAAFLKADLA